MNIKVPFSILEAAQLCRAKKDIRYYLNGIAFLPDGRVAATNGHHLFSGEKFESTKPLKETLIFDIQNSPVRKYHYAVVNDVTNVITFHDHMDVQIGIAMVKPIDGRFPDIDRIINIEEKPCSAICFNAKYLAMLPKVTKSFNNKLDGVKLTFSGSDGAAKSEFSNHHDEKGIFVVMPMRL